MDKRLLNLQADKIEAVLIAHKAPARVWGGRLTPRTVQFHLAPTATTKLTRLEALTEEVALALGVSNARLTRTNGTLSLEVPRTDSRFVTLAELEAQLQRDDATRRALACAGTAVLGLDSEGVPLLLRLSSPDVAHVLIAGTTGSGKTELARTIIASLTAHQKPRDLQLALFDPKRHGLAPFAQLPHLLFPIVADVEETLARLRYLVTEMERRERDPLHVTRPRIVVVMDELADALQTGGAPLEAALTRLVQRGRSAGVSVIACTQKPTASAVGTLIKANFPVRLVGRVAGSEDARVAAGIGGTGAEKLAGRGDFILIAGGQMIRFQAAQIKADQVARKSMSYVTEPVRAPMLGRMLGGLRRVK
ncbi:MAG: DNA translocase FtsK [Chloroflexi bacterium]|nr:DNA translocase FtsK [Chloroflexota bacterium]